MQCRPTTWTTRFPVFNVEKKQHVPKPRRIAFPKGVSQAASRSAVRKKKKEQKSLLIAPVNEGVNDQEFTRRADELRQERWEERVKVKADTRFGQRQVLCHDRPINALPLKQANTDAKE